MGADVFAALPEKSPLIIDKRTTMRLSIHDRKRLRNLHYLTDSASSPGARPLLRTQGFPLRSLPYQRQSTPRPCLGFRLKETTAGRLSDTRGSFVPLSPDRFFLFESKFREPQVTSSVHGQRGCGRGSPTEKIQWPVTRIARPNAIVLYLIRSSSQRGSLRCLRTIETDHGETDFAECG